MTELPSVKSQLPEIKVLAKRISSLLYLCNKTPSYSTFYKINDRFKLQFHNDYDTDIYVRNNTVYIPVMSKEKLNGLPQFFVSIGYPYAIHHEVCHLLDLSFIRRYNLEMPSEEELEERATQVEYLLTIPSLELSGVS